MRCPYCKKDNDTVIDSRLSKGGFVIRRRRECLECKKRYTTYERVEQTPVRAIKKDGSRVSFNRNKILKGLIRACEKRPVSIETLEEVADSIEQEIYRTFDREVPTKYIGELVMERLKSLDKVAYIRFASVYREFKDVNDFVKEAKPMLKRK